MGWFANGAHRASKLVTGARALILASAVLSLGTFAAVPTVAAATPIKVVIVVGPNGNSGVASNIADAKRLAAQARGFGATVIEIYSPNATWSKVVAAAQHANILIDMGHGNGWPSPYKPFQENTKDGLGLNASAGHGNTNVKYYGAAYVKKYIHLAPGAVVILRGMCYTAGNSEPGNPVPTMGQGRAADRQLRRRLHQGRSEGRLRRAVRRRRLHPPGAVHGNEHRSPDLHERQLAGRLRQPVDPHGGPHLEVGPDLGRLVHLQSRQHRPLPALRRRRDRLEDLGRAVTTR